MNFNEALKQEGNVIVFEYKPTIDIEYLAEQVHNTWIEQKKKQGITNHPSMIPYNELPESEKELDRATVKSVLNNIHHINYVERYSIEIPCFENNLDVSLNNGKLQEKIVKRSFLKKCKQIITSEIENSGYSDVIKTQIRNKNVLEVLDYKETSDKIKLLLHIDIKELQKGLCYLFTYSKQEDKLEFESFRKQLIDSVLGKKINLYLDDMIENN